jgi:hypothetical protein
MSADGDREVYRSFLVEGATSIRIHPNFSYSPQNVFNHDHVGSATAVAYDLAIVKLPDGISDIASTVATGLSLPDHSTEGSLVQDTFMHGHSFEAMSLDHTGGVFYLGEICLVLSFLGHSLY